MWIHNLSVVFVALSNSLTTWLHGCIWLAHAIELPARLMEIACLNLVIVGISILLPTVIALVEDGKFYFCLKNKSRTF